MRGMPRSCLEPEWRDVAFIDYVVTRANVFLVEEPELAEDLIPRLDPRENLFLRSNGEALAAELVASVDYAPVPVVSGEQAREEP